MSKISEMRVNIWNKYQSRKLIAVLEHNYPRLMKIVGIVSGVLTLPFRMLVWVVIGLLWVVEKIEAAIDYVGESADELVHLINVVIVVAVYKIILKIQRR